MCAAKSPISMLQEYTMMKHLPFPNYDIMQQGTGFKCIVTVGDIQKEAVAESKKRAKHLCAEKALGILNPYNVEVSVLSNGLIEPECAMHATIRVSIDIEEPNFNAIGKLNEICSQNGRSFPIYAELGCVEQKFVIQCALLSHVTEGHASTKKRAKQKAAKEMLDRVQLSDLDMMKESNAESKKASHTSDMEEKVVKLFKQLSPSKRQDPQAPNDLIDLFEHKPVPKDSRKIDDQDTKESVTVEILDEMELRDELQRLNVTYAISTLQLLPLILSLKTMPINGKSYTFIYGGGSYSDIVVVLLKKALEGIHILNK